MKGHLHPGCLEEHGPLLGPGAALLLKEVGKGQDESMSPPVGWCCVSLVSATQTTFGGFSSRLCPASRIPILRPVEASRIVFLPLCPTFPSR